MLINITAGLIYQWNQYQYHQKPQKPSSRSYQRRLKSVCWVEIVSELILNLKSFAEHAWWILSRQELEKAGLLNKTKIAEGGRKLRWVYLQNTLTHETHVWGVNQHAYAVMHPLMTLNKFSRLINTLLMIIFGGFLLFLFNLNVMWFIPHEKYWIVFTVVNFYCKLKYSEVLC